MTTKPVLPEFTRWSWASVPERLWWNPLFMNYLGTFQAWERLSVAMGMRRGCWQPVKPEQLVTITDWARKVGLVAIPTHRVKDTGGYASCSQPCNNCGDKFAYRTLICQPDAVNDFYKNLDSNHVGEVLGYPTCCQKHFDDTWAAGQVDSTWEQWSGTKTMTVGHTALRHLGIRLVPHLPCRWDCEATNKIAEQFLDIGRKAGNPEEMLFVKEVLKWPMQWSRLFGIAEAVSPAVKISSRTDWTPTKDAFAFDGTYHKPESWIWTDNGFDDPRNMRDAHKILIDALREKLPQGARVLDLGCGNGHLLRRLTIYRPDIKIAGVDMNASAVQHAPSLVGKWWTGTIESTTTQWNAWKPDAALINPVRLVEMSDMDARRVREVLNDIPQVFPYAYPDAVKKHGTFEQLCATADFAPDLQVLQHTPIVSVGLVLNS